LAAERLFLIDAPNLAYRSYFAFIRQPLTSSRGMNTGAIFAFANTLVKLMDEERPDAIACVWDPPEPTPRHQRFAGYKATRQRMPDEMEDQLPAIERVIDGFRIPQIVVPAVEADDVIGTLAVRAAARGTDVYIVSSDKDFLQLVTPRLRLYNLRRGWQDLEVLGPDEVAAKWGVGPDRIRDVLALMGDASDNIPGVPGIGEKTAAELIREFGSLAAVLERAGEVKRRNVREALLAHREQALLSFDLVTIKTDVALDIDPETLRRRDPDPSILVPLFLECEFDALVKKYAPRREVRTDYRAVRTDAEIDDLVRRLREAPAFSFDLETTGLNPLEAEIIGLSFSVDEGVAFYVPTLREGGRQGMLFGFDVDRDRLPEVLARLKPVLEDPSRPKGGQNVKYDILVLARYGVAVRGIAFDTMIASYLCDPSLRQHNIDILALRYLDLRKTATEELIGKRGERQLSMRDVPDDEVLRYACEDADFALRLHRVLAPRLEQLDCKRLYREVELPLLEVLARMERAGVKVDIPRLRRLGDEFEARLCEKAEEIYALAGEAFNIDSPKQLTAVLYDKLEVQKRSGVRVKKLKTGYSTDQAILEQIAAGEDGHPIVAKILEYRTYRKLKGTYLDALPALADPDGLIHTSFNQAVAATGRLSCLPAGTLVDTQNGLVGIEEVRAGDLVRTPIGAKPVGRVERTGRRAQVEVRLENGIVCAMSPDHKVRSAGRWLEAHELGPGDPVYMSRHGGLFGDSVPDELRTFDGDPQAPQAAGLAAAAIAILDDERGAKVPRWLFRAPERVVRGFLRGLLYRGPASGAREGGRRSRRAGKRPAEARGRPEGRGRRTLRSRSREFLSDLQQLLTLFGIIARLRERRPRAAGPARAGKGVPAASPRPGYELLIEADDVLRLENPDAGDDHDAERPPARPRIAVAAIRAAPGMAEAVEPGPLPVEHAPLALEATLGLYVEQPVAAVTPCAPAVTHEIEVEEARCYFANGILVSNSSEPNLQNIPIRGEEGRRIRQAFVPRAPGNVLLSADYSQIELRVLAHVTEDETLVLTFRRGEDVHRTTAARVFGVAPEAVTHDLRSKAKVINFGIIYGMGPQRLARETGLTLEEAQRFIADYFEKFPGIKAYIDRTIDQAERTGYVQTVLGRRRLIPDIRSPNPRIRAAARNMAVNTPIQGSAADLIKVAMVRIDRLLAERGLRAQMVLQVHDELLFDVPAAEVEVVRELVRDTMENVHEGFKVPLKVDLGMGKSWLEAHD